MYLRTVNTPFYRDDNINFTYFNKIIIIDLNFFYLYLFILEIYCMQKKRNIKIIIA